MRMLKKQLANAANVARNGGPLNLRMCRTKGSSSQSCRRNSQRCGLCRAEGHQGTTCPMRKCRRNASNGSNLSMGDDIDEDTYDQQVNGEMVTNHCVSCKNHVVGVNICCPPLISVDSLWFRMQAANGGTSDGENTFVPDLTSEV